MAGGPRFWAGLLLEQSGLDSSIPTDLEAVAQWCRITVCEVEVSSFLGLFVRSSGHAGVLLKTGQDPRQRRFTLAHEIGHFAIPSHSEESTTFKCLDADVGLGRSVGRVEREANEFAAELLMPWGSFRRSMADSEPTFEDIYSLAVAYDVSVTACAIHYVRSSREACALVCTERGRIIWSNSSRTFRHALPPWGSPVPAGTVARFVWSGEKPNHSPERVHRASWVQAREDVEEVLESTFRPGPRQLMSLLWLVD